ncbi:ThiF family adenylyltransferase [Cellulomonas sp.]|uniref:HesA/MoeB/ThiF family protein n=1 Tax=Cellulomonas sp. TaxID=40001 RepID=UPI002811B5E3|nr:ThiF family adenylyltransferase [Cellulomonas sp.]
MTAVAGPEARPQVRDSVVVLTDGRRVQFRCLMELRVKEFTVPPFVVDLIPRLDGTRTVPELAAELAGSDGFTPGRLDDVLRTLRDEGLLRRAEVCAGDDRHERQRRFLAELIDVHDELPTSAAQLQARLTGATVAVVGVGGAGSWLLHSLALAGVGRLVLVDPDRVEVTNLNRQMLYGDGDVGAAKVDAAAAALRRVAPGVEVVGHPVHVERPGDLAPLVEGADLLVCCADRPSVSLASDLVATVAHATGTPHVVGGAYGANLGVPGTSVIPGRTVCWACVRQATADDHGTRALRPLKGRGAGSGSIGAVTAFVAAVMAWESLRLLLGVPPALADQVRELDVMTLEWRVRPVQGRPGCATCAGPGRLREPS